MSTWTRKKEEIKEGERKRKVVRGNYMEAVHLFGLWSTAPPNTHTHTHTPPSPAHIPTDRPPCGLLAMLAEIQLHFCWQPEENNWPITAHQNAVDMYDFLTQLYLRQSAAARTTERRDRFIPVKAASGVKFGFAYTHWFYRFFFFLCVWVIAVWGDSLSDPVSSTDKWRIWQGGFIHEALFVALVQAVIYFCHSV